MCVKVVPALQALPASDVECTDNWVCGNGPRAPGRSDSKYAEAHGNRHGRCQVRFVVVGPNHLNMEGEEDGTLQDSLFWKDTMPVKLAPKAANKRVQARSKKW